MTRPTIPVCSAGHNIVGRNRMTVVHKNGYVEARCVRCNSERSAKKTLLQGAKKNTAPKLKKRTPFKADSKDPDVARAIAERKRVEKMRKKYGEEWWRHVSEAA